MAQRIQIKQDDWDALQTIMQEKQAVLTQIGAVEEMKDRPLEDLRAQNKRRGELEDQMSKEYLIPENKVWRLDKDQTIMILDPAELQM